MAPNPAITADGKIVIITGGSKGIGYAIINAFGIANASAIVLLARNKAAFEKVKILLNSIFVNTIFCHCPVNITNSMVMNNVFRFIRDNLEKPNVLVFGAAYFHPLKTGFEVAQEKLDRSFNVNFNANINLVYYFFDLKSNIWKSKFSLTYQPWQLTRNN